MYKDILNKTLLMNDSELEKFIENRKLELEKMAFTEDESCLKSINDGYIAERTKISISEGSFLTYNLIGIDYLEYIKFLKEQVVDANDLYGIIIITGMYVSEFFKLNILEPYVDNRKQCILTESIHMGLQVGFNNSLEPVVSLKNPSINIFKGIGQGACLEHSLLMHQLLSFIGVDMTTLVLYGYAQEVKECIGHTVNVIHLSQTEHLYYDLIFQEVSYDENNNLMIVPYVMSISDEMYKKVLFEGERLEVKCMNVLYKKGMLDLYFYLASDDALRKVNREIKQNSKWVIKIRKFRKK